MKKKIVFPVFLFSLVLSGTIFVHSAEAKTVKKMIVKSINHDEKTLKSIKNGDTYTVNATNAKIRKGSTGSSKTTFSKIEEGDVVTIEGSFDGKDVTATKVRNLSYYDKKTVTFYGRVDTVNESTNTVKIKPIDRDDQTISISSSTKIKNEDGDTIALTDLKEDDRVLVTGKWSRKNDTITKTKTIDVLDDDDYDDLSDLLPTSN